MTIDKMNFHYPKGNLQSVYSHEEMTALELAAATSGKVDECIEMVNGVEQSAIEATQIVDNMRFQQDNFITDNTDIRAQMITDNQNLLMALELSNETFQTDINTSKTTFETAVNLAKTNFENDVNLSKTTFETNMNNSLLAFKGDLETEKQDFISAANDVLLNSETNIANTVNTKLDAMTADGSLKELIDVEIMGGIRLDIANVKSDIDKIGLFVTDFNAKGDGITDDTAAIQAAINYASLHKNKTVLFPQGNYRVTNIEMLSQQYNNIKLVGIGDATIKQILPANRHMQGSFGLPTYARTQWADGIIVIDACVYDPVLPIESYAIKDITIDNIHFINNVVTELFDELSHQICVSGVMDFTVKNCKFTGFLGDGICVTSGRDEGLSAYLDNKNVNIINNKFDGVNKENRQAISIYNCDTFNIEGNHIVNTTRSNMPGAIDIEPSHEVEITRNGIIQRNIIKNCGGNVGAIAIVMFNTTTDQDASIIIRENSIIDCNTAFSVNSAGSFIDGSYKNVLFEDNYVLNCNPFHLVNSQKVDIVNNHFENVTFVPYTIKTCDLINIKGNVFLKVNNADGLVIDGISTNIKIDDNIFRNVLKTAITNNGDGLVSLQRNIFKITRTANAICYVTSLKTDIATIHYKFNDNVVSSDFYQGRLMTTGELLNGGTAQNGNSSPNNFEYGEGALFTGVDSLGVGSGFLKTFKYTPDGGINTVGYQEFIPIDSSVEFIYIRNILTSTTWSDWKTISKTAIV